MLKGYSKIAKKTIPEDFDSADELEASIDENDLPSQKLPHSNIKLDPSRFSSKGLETGHQHLKERRNSPLREKNSNSQNLGKYAIDNEESAKLKKILYNKSPKEAANEYMAMSKPQSQPKTKLSRHGESSPREKSYPYSFNSGTASNKENFARDDDYEGAGVSAHTELAAKIYNKKFQTNPQSRQTDLGRMAHDNLLLSNHELQKIEEKRYYASGETQEDVVERLRKQGEIMNEHTKALTNAYLTKEFEECTFAPQVKSDNRPPRSIEQFLEDQRQFQEQTEMKKKRAQEKAMIEKSKEDGTYKPKINQNSVKMLEKRKKEQGPVYQRLYSMGKNAQMKHMRVIAEKEDMYNNCESVASSQFIGAINTKGDSYYSQEGSSLDRGGTPKFVPNIHKKSKNLRRGERIDNLLYNDALRRQHKSLEASKTQSKSSTVGMSSASKRALAIRFIKEFDIAILEFLEMGKEPKLNYIKLNEFLKKLCFLKESEQVDNPHFTPERLLLYDAWYTLQADKYNGVHRRNLLVFLLGILNLHFPITKIQAHNAEEEQYENREEDKDAEDQEDDMGNSPMFDQFKNPILPEEEGHAARERRIIGSFDEDGNYELTESEVRRLHKIYELWYLNRLCSGDNLGQLISMRSQQEYSHHPEINETSRNLAQNYREKMLEGTADLIQQNKIPAPKDGKITHVDLLIVSKKVLEEKVNRYGELIKDEQAKDCTFKPTITQYDHGLNSSTMRTGQQETDGRSAQSRRQKTMPADSMGRDRVFELYALAKPQILKKDKDALEVDLEKNMKECTFQPNINRNDKSYMEDPSEFYAKGIEKTIERMRSARAEKERLLQQKERGFTTGTERNFVFAIDKKKFGKDKTLAEQGNSLQRDVYRGNFAYNYNGAPQYMSNQRGMEHQAHMMQGDTYEGQEEYQGYQYQGQEGRGHTYGLEHDDQELNEVQEDENEARESNYDSNRYGQGQGNNEEQPHFERDQGEDREGDERVPLLFVDVNLGQGRSERIVVYEGDKSEDLAREFAEEHGLDPSMKIKLKELLDNQIASLLSQIDEELNSDTERNHQSENYVHDQIQEEDYVEEDSTGER